MRRTSSRRYGAPRWLALIGALLLLGLPLSAVAQTPHAATVTASASRASHKKTSKPGCKSGYKKETKTVHEVKRHHKVTVHETVCVRAGSTSGGSGGSGAGGSGSGGSGGSGGAGGGGAFPASPVATNDSYSVLADGTLTIAGSGVIANDQGSDLSASVIAGVADGTLAFNHNGSFSYTPNPGFTGTDHFTYKDIDPSFNSSNVASVTITVEPLVPNASYDATCGTTFAVGAPGVLNGAVGAGLSVSLVSSVSHGTLTLNSDGSFSYTATPGYTGTDSFSYHATDAAGGVSNVATVTFSVALASGPSVVPQNYTGEVANTELQVGGSRGGGPEVFLGSTNALAGDFDPNGGTLSTTAATIPTAEGGTATLAADGTFTYAPPAGFDGSSDSFNYQVVASDGRTSTATATIDFVPKVVWYVNDTAGSGGNGTSGSPFDTLAAASAAASPGNFIFLFASGTPYTGGISLATDQTLDGAAAGLVIDGTTIFSAAGVAPEITSSGAGIVLANDDDVDGVAVANTGGDGISATGVDSFTLGSGVSVSNASGDGLFVSGGSGTISVGAQISGSADHSVAISGRSGGTATLSGAISDSGEGVSLTANTGATINITGTLTANTSADPAFTAAGGGTVSATGDGSTLTTTTGTALDVANTTIGAGGLDFQSISAGDGSAGPAEAIIVDHAGNVGALDVTGTGVAGSGGTIDGATSTAGAGGAIDLTDASDVELDNMDVENGLGNGVYADDVGSLTLADNSFTDNAASGVIETGDGSVTQTFAFNDNLLTGQGDTAIDIAFAGNASGTLLANTVGDATAGSGSLAGDGIAVTNDAGAAEVELERNAIESIATGNGIAGSALTSGALSLTVEQNHVTMGGTGSGDAMAYVSSGSAPSTLCLATSGNVATAAGANANGTSVAEDSSSSVFQLEDYPGGPLDASAISTFLEAQDNLTGGVDGQGAVALNPDDDTTGFPAASCPLPGGGDTT